MKNSKYIISGIVVGLLIVPLVDKIFEIVLTWLELLKIYPNKKLLNYQKDTAVLREFIKPAEPTPDYEVKYIYGDDYDDDDE
jgi:hypothetical protein